MNQKEFQQILLYILQKAGKPLHVAIVLRIIADTKKCDNTITAPITMDDGKKLFYIPIVTGCKPGTERNNRYPSFYLPFAYDDTAMTISSSKAADMTNSSKINCLDQFISTNKDKVYVPRPSSNCDCIDW